MEQRQVTFADRIARAKRSRLANLVCAVLLGIEAAFFVYTARTLPASPAVSLSLGRLVNEFALGLAALLAVSSLPCWISVWTWGSYLRILRWTLASSRVVARGLNLAPVIPTQPQPLPAEFSLEQHAPRGMVFGPFARAGSQYASFNRIAGVLELSSGLLAVVYLVVLLAPDLASNPSAELPLGSARVTPWTLAVAGCGVWIVMSTFSGVRMIWRAQRNLHTDRFVADSETLALVAGERRKPRARPALPTLDALQARYLIGALLGGLGLGAFASLAAGVPLIWVAVAVGAILLTIIMGGLAWRGAAAPQAAGAPPNGMWRVLRAAIAPPRQADAGPVAWGDLRGFFLLDHWRDLLGVYHATYGVHTGRRLVVWVIASDADEAMLASHDALCRMIVTRTGLLLRDVSAIAASLAPYTDQPHHH